MQLVVITVQMYSSKVMTLKVFRCKNAAK